MELAIPEVDELFPPVELKVEAALDWLNSESSLSSVLKEFLVHELLDLLTILVILLVFSCFCFLWCSLGEKEFREEMEEPARARPKGQEDSQEERRG